MSASSLWGQSHRATKKHKKKLEFENLNRLAVIYTEMCIHLKGHEWDNILWRHSHNNSIAFFSDRINPDAFVSKSCVWVFCMETNRFNSHTFLGADRDYLVQPCEPFSRFGEIVINVVIRVSLFMQINEQKPLQVQLSPLFWYQPFAIIFFPTVTP